MTWGLFHILCLTDTGKSCSIVLLSQCSEFPVLMMLYIATWILQNVMVFLFLNLQFWGFVYCPDLLLNTPSWFYLNNKTFVFRNEFFHNIISLHRRSYREKIKWFPNLIPCPVALKPSYCC